MIVIIRGRAGSLRSAASFTFSASIHGSILAWLICSPSTPAPEQPRNLYDQVIRPHEKRVVWYNLRERLPDVSPEPTPLDPRPQKARQKFSQSIVAHTKV